jgi:uncharacterized protein YPO0396
MVKSDSVFREWIEHELAGRFDLACCETQEQFRRELRAVTRSGQIKLPGERHEKNDRYRIDDRSQYVLGWTNAAKIAALESRKSAIESSLGRAQSRVVKVRDELQKCNKKKSAFSTLTGEYGDFREIDWPAKALEIARLLEEKKKIESGSEILRQLTERLNVVGSEMKQAEEKLKIRIDERARIGERKEKADAERTQSEQIARMVSFTAWREQLDSMRVEALGEQRLTVESCDSREHEVREWLQKKRIDPEMAKLERIRERILKAMSEFRNAFRLETAEIDASMEAASEYRQVLVDLQEDGLPSFEAKFKELLNENTIREIANFQSQLAKERENIKDRITRINESLAQIDYNPGRYIVLEAEVTSNVEVRSFQSELRACTEGTITGANSDQYSEDRFLKVKSIIERFRGREGQAEMDRRWTSRVTDVRNWFEFAASERWREDGIEFEHYSDSSGKSGGQKEKLAYTILAASLAYQFGLEWGEVRSKSFRFVVIDEAFGRGSDESAQYGLQLFAKLNLQILIATPLQKIHVIEPFVSSVGFVQNEDGRSSKIRNLTIDEYRAEKARYSNRSLEPTTGLQSPVPVAEA